jgi:hypothetical protein
MLKLKERLNEEQNGKLPQISSGTDDEKKG